MSDQRSRPAAQSAAPLSPFPAIAGLYAKPTVVNNVLTLATVPTVLADGAQAYQQRGVARSRGTQVFQLGADRQTDRVLLLDLHPAVRGRGMTTQ